MKFLTKEIRKKLPKRQNVDHVGDYIAHAKFFLVCGAWTWYACEFDGEDVFYGFVIGPCPEFGTFSMAELQSLRFSYRRISKNMFKPVITDKLTDPPAVERDKFFKPKKLRDIPEVAAHLHL